MGKRSNGEGGIYKRADGIWCGQYYEVINGVKKRKSVYGKTQKIVKSKLEERFSELNNKVPESKSIMLEDWVAEWLDDYKKNMLKQTTYENYYIYYETHIKNSTIGKMALEKLTTNDLQAYYNEKLKNGRSDGKGRLSPRTVRYLHIIIRGAVDQAVKNGLLERNVSKYVVLPAKKHKEIQPLTIEEVNTFLETAKEDRLFALYLLEITTGIRKGEILGLQWSNIDFVNKRLSIQQSLCNVRDYSESGRKYKLVLMEPKTEKSKRLLPLNDSVIAALTKYREQQSIEKQMYEEIYIDNNTVFTRETGEFINPRELLRRYQVLLKKAGIEPKRFHDLRHTFASILLNEKESPKVIQELLGHANISTTMDIYSHVLEETKVKSVEKLANKLQL